MEHFSSLKFENLYIYKITEFLCQKPMFSFHSYREYGPHSPIIFPPGSELQNKTRGSKYVAIVANRWAAIYHCRTDVLSELAILGG